MNDAPKIIAHPAIGVEDEPFTFKPVVKDIDSVDFYHLVVEAQGQNVFASVSEDGHVLSITASHNWSGSDVLQISAVDAAGAKSEIVKIPVLIQPVNNPPVVSPVVIVTDEDVPGRAKVLFTDPDGAGPYRYVINGQPSSTIGGCGIDGDSVVFTPSKDWNGTTSCRVSVIDNGGAASNDALVTITVNAVPDKPVVESRTITLNQGASTAVTIAVSDPDINDTFTLASSTAQDASFGVFSFSGSTLNVSLDPAFVGSRVIQYSATDSFGLGSEPGFITVKVLPVNIAPVVDAQTAVTSIETPVSVELTATDTNHDSPLSFSVVETVPASSGSLQLDKNVLTFTPVAGFKGTATAKVTATDPSGATSAPQAITFTVQDDQVIAYDPDVPDTHTIVIVQQPPTTVGTLTVTGMNVKFVPVDGYFGSASFKYKVRDEGGLESAVKDGQIVAEKTNYAPTAATAELFTFEGGASTPVTPTVTDKNLYDAGRHTFSVPVQSMTGVAEVVNNQLVYNAPYGFQGKTAFKFIARDIAGAEVVGTANVTVSAKNYAPTSVSLVMDTTEATAVTGVPIVTDPNPSDSFTYQMLTTPIGGTATIANGKITYLPGDGWIGTDSFNISATDAGGLTVTGTVTVTVLANNVAPSELSGEINALENTAAAPYYPVIKDKNLYDIGKHALKVVTQPSGGSVFVVNNLLVFTPNKDFVGDDMVVVEATDLGGLKVDGSVSIHVLKNNLSPETASLSITTSENQKSPAKTPVVSDPNAWDTFTYEVVSQPSHGSVLVGAGGYSYTPEKGYVGNDTFEFRVVDAGGEYIESVAQVAVLRNNEAPTGLTPSTVYFYEGVGGKQRLTAIDPNLWGSHTFEVVAQPEHGYVWFNGNDEMNYKTDGRTATSVQIKVIDQDGLSVNVTVKLLPKNIDSAIGQLPVTELLTDKVSTPAVTKDFNHTDGRPGLMVTEQQAVAALGTDVIAFVEKNSDVGLNVGRKALEPGQAVRMSIDRVTNTSIGAAVSAIKAGEAGNGRILLVRADLTGSAYALPFEVWKLIGGVKTSADSAPLGLQTIRAQFEAGNSVCINTVRAQSAQIANPYDNPVCLLEFSKPFPEYKDLSSDSTLAIIGTASEAGTYPIEASSYIVGADGQKYLLGTYVKNVTFVSPVGAVRIGPKYPFDKAYLKVEDLDVEFTQKSGVACDLTIVERRAITAASSYTSRPLCLVEWEEIPPGLVTRANWEKPYLLGNAQMLGDNAIRWRVSAYTPSGKKLDLGTDAFSFSVVEPSLPTVSYTSSTKVNDNLLVSPIAGAYIGDAVVSSVSARLQLKNNVNLGKDQTEVVAAAYGDTMSVSRRIYTAAFSGLWQKRGLYMDASYALLPDVLTHSTIDVLSVPDESVVPIIDNENGKVLSTEAFEVNVGMGDAYDTSKAYSASTMGGWEIRLVQKPTWNTVEEVAPWVRADGAGKAAFAVDIASLAGKNLRVFAEARVISPVPEYSVTRTSPQPLSVAILNGAALDGSIRALRLTGEAPLRLTLFADVTNRAWTRDLGNVRWELSTSGGPWTELPNSSRTPQRIAMTLAKGKYKIRAELTNKNSGAKSMTDEIEIQAYNIPKGVLKGPGNTFLDADATFKVLQTDAKPIDLPNIDVEWSYDRGATWTPGTDSVVLTRSAEARVYVYMRMRYKDSPKDDLRAWKTLRSGVAFRKVRPPRVQIVGPTRPEVGK
ncbi:Ig-like domain-containing protein, partial [Pseudomonas sp. LS-2]|uniref:Ig-like domain-containing protein n=1 Tax=Pseudomonas sp. LS-2 TaxID=2315859 RepID=UPI00281275BC